DHVPAADAAHSGRADKIEIKPNCKQMYKSAETEYHMANTNFELECTLVGMYIDSGKSYTQLSTGALALVAVFAPMKLSENKVLLVASALFLAAALAGGAYQALAVGRLERLSDKHVERPLLHWWQENAYLFYNALVAAFHLGAISLALVHIGQLWS